jgi:hypothetical protein
VVNALQLVRSLDGVADDIAGTLGQKEYIVYTQGDNSKAGVYTKPEESKRVVGKPASNWLPPRRKPPQTLGRAEMARRRWAVRMYKGAPQSASRVRCRGTAGTLPPGLWIEVRRAADNKRVEAVVAEEVATRKANAEAEETEVEAMSAKGHFIVVPVGLLPSQLRASMPWSVCLGYVTSDTKDLRPDTDDDDTPAPCATVEIYQLSANTDQHLKTAFTITVRAADVKLHAQKWVMKDHVTLEDDDRECVTLSAQWTSALDNAARDVDAEEEDEEEFNEQKEHSEEEEPSDHEEGPEVMESIARPGAGARKSSRVRNDMDYAQIQEGVKKAPKRKRKPPKRSKKS